LSTNAFSGLKISHTCICGRGSAADSDGGTYSAPLYPLAGWRDRRGRGKMKGEWEGEVRGDK